MFANTITFRYDTEDKTHNRTSFAPGVFVYSDDTEGVNQTVRIQQNTTKQRFRREVRVSRDKIAQNPLTGVNQEVGASVYLVIDEPRIGFTDSELNDMAISLTKFLSGAAATDSGVTEQVLRGEA